MRYYICDHLEYGERRRYGWEYHVQYKPLFHRKSMPVFIEEDEDGQRVRREYLTGVVVDDYSGCAVGNKNSKSLMTWVAHEVTPTEFESYLNKYSEKQKSKYAAVIREWDAHAKELFMFESKRQEGAQERLNKRKKY